MTHPDPGSRLGWWTRVPSLRSCAVLAVPAAVAAVVAVLAGDVWVTGGSLVLAAAAASATWWHGETAWRREYPTLDASHPVQADVDAVAGRFGLLRRPVVLLADDLGSPAGAVDTAHPGSTLLVTTQLLGWLAQGGRASVQAVLAHELSHLHRFHLVVGIVQRLVGFALALQLSALAGLQAAAAQFALGPGGPGSLPVLASAATAAWLAAPALSVVQSHLCELDADRDAARLGHGHALAALFSGDGPRRVVRRGLFTHPHPRMRTRALARLNGR